MIVTALILPSFSRGVVVRMEPQRAATWRAISASPCNSIWRICSVEMVFGSTFLAATALQQLPRPGGPARQNVDGPIAQFRGKRRPARQAAASPAIPP